MKTVLALTVVLGAMAFAQKPLTELENTKLQLIDQKRVQLLQQAQAADAPLVAERKALIEEICSHVGVKPENIDKECDIRLVPADRAKFGTVAKKKSQASNPVQNPTTQTPPSPQDPTPAAPDAPAPPPDNQ